MHGAEKTTDFSILRIKSDGSDKSMDTDKSDIGLDRLRTLYGRFRHGLDTDQSTCPKG